MKKTEAYEDLSAAQKYEIKFNKGKERKNFCFKSFALKIEGESSFSGPWGGDDVMHWFDDGSMILQRNIVKEFQLFKP